MTGRTILACVLAALAALALAAVQVIKWAEGPVVPSKDLAPYKIVSIPDGSTFQQVATLLERERLIKSRTAFILLGRTQSADRKIRAGEYELNAGMIPAEILSKLINGQVVLHPVTIPEGLSMVQIADLMAQHEVVDLSSATAALERIRAGERYDLIICDLMMPHMTGMDFHAALSGEAPDQARRMVFLTGGAFTARAHEFLDSVAAPRMDKPFEIKAMRALVDERLRLLQ